MSITRDAEVVGVTQDATGVDVTVHASDGAERRYRSSYAVGADGIRSAVRGAIGPAVPRSRGGPVAHAGRRAPAPTRPGDLLSVNGVGDWFAFVAPFGDGWYRIFAWNRLHQVDDSAPLSFPRSARSPGRPWAPTSGCTTPDSCPGSTATSGRSRATGWGGCSWPVDAAHCHSPAGARA